jgi:hypothetical protein
VSGFPEVAVWRALSWLSHITVPPADTVTVGGSYPSPLVEDEEPRGITTVVSPPPAVPVALAAPVALVAFVPCAIVSVGLKPRIDTVKRTDTILAPMMILLSNCLNFIENYQFEGQYNHSH